VLHCRGVKGWGGLETSQGRQEKASRAKTRQDKTKHKTRQGRQGQARQDKILTSEFSLLTSELTNSFANSDVFEVIFTGN
jgi:hypothetical protein